MGGAKGRSLAEGWSAFTGFCDTLQNARSVGRTDRRNEKLLAEERSRGEAGGWMSTILGQELKTKRKKRTKKKTKRRKRKEPTEKSGFQVL